MAAVGKSKELEQVIEDDNFLSNDEPPESEDDTDEAVVHKAMGVHLNNEFGSRHLIEDRYSLVYSISYPDLRLFLTSADQQNIASHKITDSGGIVPDNILPRDQRGKLVVAVADNWNLNERTIDGKRTTNAMTSMLVSSAPAESTRIPRLPKATSRTFDSQSLPGLQELLDKDKSNDLLLDIRFEAL
ncbi:hypothetical protein DPMN_120575 [Dreissena polymorpha]|uniref:Uncharacterized protein n=1 Tax=Dreissena polymorpha TaxID=45954 RepID=A0A9D4GNJ8_DREPO|nr:hypothetical protein DPMN_120575 [Dreissena polymorpha]